jgi:AraC-like DNA-binding protein
MFTGGVMMQVSKIRVNHQLEELAVHGSPDFPLVVYIDDFSLFDSGQIDWHWHQALQYSYVLAGALQFDIGSTQYCLKPGEAIFINRGILHQIKPVTSEPTHMFTIDFDPKLMVSNEETLLFRQYVEPIITSKSIQAVVIAPEKPIDPESHKASSPPQPMDSVNTQAYPNQSAVSCAASKSDQLHSLNSTSFLNALYTIYEYAHHQVSDCELAMVSALISSWHDLYHLLKHHIGLTPISDPHTAKVKNALRFIHVNYADDITLGDIADSANISKGECCRAFQQLLHMTPFAYLLSHRIQMASDRLVTTDLPIADIAINVGFNHVSYFGKVFRRLKGMTPSQYRKANKR